MTQHSVCFDLPDGKLTYYEIKVTYKYERTIRDEFGWVEGHGPGCGDFKERSLFFNVVAWNERSARLWTEDYLKGCKDVSFDSIEKREIQFDGKIDRETFR